MTTCDEIYKILKDPKKENRKIEFKEFAVLTNKDDKLGYEFVAIANRVGGMLFIGIRNDGTFEGKTISVAEFESNREIIDGICHVNISPLIDYNIELLKCQEGDVIIVHIPRRRGVPHAYINNKDGWIKSRIYYIRTDYGKRLVSDHTLGQLFCNKEDMEYIEDIEERKMIKNEVSKEDIELCLYALNGETKAVRKEGFEELKSLIYKMDVINESISKVVEESLKDEDAEINKDALQVLEIMIGKFKDIEESKKELDRFIPWVIKLARSNKTLDVRPEAIQVLMQMESEELINATIAILNDESARSLPKFYRLRNDVIKNKLKFEIFKILNDPTLPEDDNIRKRIKELLEDIRRG